MTTPRRPRARRSRLEVLTDLAQDAAGALEAAARLRQGRNGQAVTQLATAIEREVRTLMAARMRQRRRSAQRRR